MIYKEVLTSIDEDDFLDTAERTLSAADMLKLDPREWRQFARGYKGLAAVGNYIALDSLLQLRPRQGVRYKSGAIMSYIALKEYFADLQLNLKFQPEHYVTNQWLQSISPKLGRQAIKSYLYREEEEKKKEGRPESTEVPLEMIRAFDEYPAMAKYVYTLEAEMGHRQYSQAETEQVAWGAQLGLVAIRELVEIEELKNNLSYVYPEQPSVKGG
jgi:hypothetical protein